MTADARAAHLPPSTSTPSYETPQAAGAADIGVLICRGEPYVARRSGSESSPLGSPENPRSAAEFFAESYELPKP